MQIISTTSVSFPKRRHFQNVNLFIGIFIVSSSFGIYKRNNLWILEKMSSYVALRNGYDPGVIGPQVDQGWQVCTSYFLSSLRTCRSKRKCLNDHICLHNLCEICTHHLGLQYHPSPPSPTHGYLRAPTDQNICLGHLRRKRRKQLSISWSHPEKVVVYFVAYFHAWTKYWHHH